MARDLYKSELRRDAARETNMPAQRILIVDDNAPARRALGTILGLRGWVVTEAGTVEEALRSIHLPEPPDGIILDLQLPDGAGEDVLRQVREEGLPIRVAVCSGMPEWGQAGSFDGAPPDAVLAKPVRIEDIVRVFDAVGTEG
jgi:two-component system KDP operon response regulator KdpE